RRRLAKVVSAAVGLAVLVAAAVVLLLRWDGGSSPKPQGTAAASAATASSTTARVDPSQPKLAAANPERPGVTIATAKFDLPDPYLFPWGDKYYLYVSTAFGTPPSMNIPVLVAPRPPNIPRPASANPAALAHWGPVRDALPTLPAWARPAPGTAGRKVWAPDVVRHDGRFLLYFAAAVRNGPSPLSHCLGVATANTPEGPFVPVPGPPIVCQLALGGDIDPQFFVDPNGPEGPAHPYYLIWKSDNNVLPNLGQDTAWAAPLRNGGLALSGPAVPILTVHQAWEQPFLEAPQMVKAPNGSYWLVFSTGSGFWLPGSALGIAQCAGPLGPCRDARTSPLIGSNAQGSGPGEETVYVSPTSGVWILYSPWSTGTLAPYRPVEAAHLSWNSQGPELVAPGLGPIAAG
ncbi:MAG: family 43 glycosylhydrolase, partial [Acidimicrobiaceae bacterium]|nr:family 43 glycosylhydrolase [Acidimicrobiaceae bacterium]